MEVELVFVDKVVGNKAVVVVDNKAAVVDNKSVEAVDNKAVGNKTVVKVVGNMAVDNIVADLVVELGNKAVAVAVAVEAGQIPVVQN